MTHSKTRTATILSFALVLTMTVAPVWAAKGGNGKGNSGKAGAAIATNASLAVTMASDGQSYVIVGRGFAPNSSVAMQESRPTCCLAYNAWAGASGAFEVSNVTGTPGTYEVIARQWDGKRYVEVARTTFIVGG